MSDTAADPFAPVSPGEVLGEEFLADFGLDDADLARATGIDPEHVRAILAGRAGISAADALRLGIFFGNSAEFWMNLQARHDLKRARRELPPEEAARIAASRAA